MVDVTLPTIPIDEHIAWLRVEGERLAAAVADASWDARVPGCPEWDVEALVRHIGDVHRWAATVVRERRQERLRLDFEGPRERGELLDWYVKGHAELLATLSGASPDDVFWSWAPAPSALAFWARRQAHETAIHRLDAEQSGGSSTPFATAQAADGIDEWLTMASLVIRATGGAGRTLHLDAVDAPGEWAVALRDDGLSVERDASSGDCTVRATASDLFALVMNRRKADGLAVEGDAGVLLAWRESVRF
jgi:uncharacterized protein (TIGR03083 family)